MINPQELRIGNLIYFGKELVKVNWAILETISKSEFHNPIPLTEEYVLKLGFTKGETDDTDRLTVFSIQISNVSALYISLAEDVLPFISYDWKSSFGHEFWKKPKFVHEVQNLYFDLTGEELTIKE